MRRYWNLIWQHQLGRRLILLLVTVSTVLSIVATSIQIFFTYQRGLERTESSFTVIENSFLPSLKQAVWHYDFPQVALILDAIVSVQDVTSARLETSSGELFDRKRGDWEDDGNSIEDANVMEKTYLLRHGFDRQDERVVGELVVTLTYQNVIAEVVQQFWTLLVTNLIKTVIATACMLVIFYYLISRHLWTIADFVRGSMTRENGPPLVLHRRSGHGDELDQIATALNLASQEQHDARERVQNANLQLQQSNTALRETISDLKVAESALRNNQRLLRDTQADAKIASWEFKYSGDNKAWHSEELYRIFGIPARTSPIAPQEVSRKIHPDDRHHYEQIAQEMRENPGPFSFGYRIIRNNEDVRSLQVTCKPYFSPGGELIGYRGTVQDVTEQRLAEEQLRQAQKMEVLGQLTGGIAHDFNNLLAIVHGNLELTMHLLPKDDPIRDLIKPSIRACNRGATLSNQLLAFSRKQSLNPERVDASHLVDGLMEFIRRSLGPSIHVSVNVERELWDCLCDPSQLESALLNLVINAKDAMKDGGELSITGENTKVTKKSPLAFEHGVAPGAYVTLSVADTGMGMSQDVIDKACEPFFTTKQVGEGSGLGLSMVYGFAKQSGGHLSIESTLGQGTTIKLTLPRFLGISMDQEQKANTAVARGKGETVLVVEDDGDVRKLVINMLDSLGYLTLSASTTAQALEHIRSCPEIDILLTDVVLPEVMNGMDLAAAARDINPHLPVLYMSGNAHAILPEFLELEAKNHLLQKPFNIHQLAWALRHRLGGHLQTPGDAKKMVNSADR